MAICSPCWRRPRLPLVMGRALWSRWIGCPRLGMIGRNTLSCAAKRKSCAVATKRPRTRSKDSIWPERTGSGHSHCWPPETSTPLPKHSPQVKAAVRRMRGCLPHTHDSNWHAATRKGRPTSPLRPCGLTIHRSMRTWRARLCRVPEASCPQRCVRMKRRSACTRQTSRRGSARRRSLSRWRISSLRSHSSGNWRRKPPKTGLSNCCAPSWPLVTGIGQKCATSCSGTSRKWMKAPG